LVSVKRSCLRIHFGFGASKSFIGWEKVSLRNPPVEKKIFNAIHQRRVIRSGTSENGMKITILSGVRRRTVSTFSAPARRTWNHVYSTATKPIASVQGEPAFFGLRRVPISAPSTARSFHACDDLAVLR
jgi:hypothetical protein